MYRIGDFSKIVGISIRTLRYYDIINLLKPDNIDAYTGYRYYSESKITEYKKILMLKDLNFTLEEIKKYKNNLSEDILMKKRDELLQSSIDIGMKIRKVDSLRDDINKNSNGKTIEKGRNRNERI